jgi:hypothetical protein
VVKTNLTNEDKRELKCIALELLELRKIVEKITETLVNASDKELMKILNAPQNPVKENQVESYKEKLEKQLDIAEKEVRLT